MERSDGWKRGKERARRKKKKSRRKREERGREDMKGREEKARKREGEECVCSFCSLSLSMDIDDWYTHCQFHYLWISYPTMHCNHKPYWPTHLEAIRTLM